MIRCVHFRRQDIGIVQFFWISDIFGDIFFYREAQTERMVKHNLIIFLIAESLSVAIAMTTVNPNLAILIAAELIQTVHTAKLLNLLDFITFFLINKCYIQTQQSLFFTANFQYLTKHFVSNQHDAFRKHVLQVPPKSFTF